MDGNAAMDNANEQNMPVEAAEGSVNPAEKPNDPELEMNSTGAAATPSSDDEGGKADSDADSNAAVSTSAAAPSDQRRDDVPEPTSTKPGEDDAELARMMAFQEEQQAGQNGAQAAAAGNIPDNDANNHRMDPNVAFLGDDPANEEAEQHPNLNNPAAIALRQRQALQNAARLNPHANNPFRNQPYLVRKVLSFLQPSLRYVPLSLMAAALLLHHTLRTRQQFYLAVVYLQSSKLAYILLGNAIIALAVSFFTIMTKLFLDGGLRPNERDAIGENIRWDVTETCLALTIFRSELDVVTAIEFLVLVIMKCLHWSVDLRGGHLRMTEEIFIYPDEDEDSLNANNDDAPASNNQPKKAWYQLIPRVSLVHIQYYSLVQILLLLDILAVAHCALSVATRGPSVDILFGFEAAILLISALSAMGSYHLHVIDGVMGWFHRLAEGEHHHVHVGGRDEGTENGDETDSPPQQGVGGNGDGNTDTVATPPVTRTEAFAKTLVERFANPWRDRRATLSFAIELQAQAAKFLFYMVFFAIVFTYYGMPINIFREVYVSFQKLRRRLIAFNTYRRLTHNMEKRFESIKDQEELDRLGHTCIICREQMDLLGGCKKLPGCGHAFHTHCLREWLVQQQTCPTCRADIAANEAREKKRLERERVAAERAAGADGEDGATPAADVGAGDANKSSVDNVTPQGSEGLGTDGDASQGQASGQTASGSRREKRSATSARPPKDNALPDGWTQHIDGLSGRTYYYNRELGQSSWEKPVAPVANNNTVMPSSTESGLSDSQSTAQFPSLYRITSSSGAPVFSRGPDNSLKTPQRVVRCGKLIVCTSMENCSMPIGEKMLCMPDGYVRCQDVEHYLNISAPNPKNDAD